MIALVDDQHLQAVVGQLPRHHGTRKTGAYHQHIGFHAAPADAVMRTGRTASSSSPRIAATVASHDASIARAMPWRSSTGSGACAAAPGIQAVAAVSHGYHRVNCAHVAIAGTHRLPPPVLERLGRFA